MSKNHLKAALFAFFLCVSCAAGADKVPIVAYGSTVTLRYVLTVDRKVVNKTGAGETLTYVQGMRQIIPGLEEKLLNMKLGEKKHLTITPDKAYGMLDSEAFLNIPRKSIQRSSKLKVGSTLTAQYEGKPMQGTVMEMDKENVSLNLNHPLAGKTLEYDIEIVKIINRN